VEFDGIGDGLIVDSLPLAEAEKFTLEIIFRPAANGPAAQRFLHLQETGSESRILIELRMPDSQNWFLDTYIKTEAGDRTLADPPKPHPVGQWYNATLIYDGEKMRHYVNGVEESSAKLAFDPLGGGKTSIGVRINRVHWFKGAIRKIRFTDEVLGADSFMQP
jgi:phosphate starvation-inducible protein PhoH